MLATFLRKNSGCSERLIIPRFWRTGIPDLGELKQICLNNCYSY